MEKHMCNANLPQYAARNPNAKRAARKQSAAEAVQGMFKKARTIPAHMTTDAAKAAVDKKMEVAVDRLANRPPEPPRDDVLFDPEASEPDVALED